MDTIFDDNIPIYLQIIDLIKKDIVVGKLKGGDKLPSVREMAASLKVNPNTLQRAYQELERLGIVYTQRGMGTFVEEDINMVNKLKKEMAEEVIQSFMIKMRSLGFSDNEIVDVIEQKTKKDDN